MANRAVVLCRQGEAVSFMGEVYRAVFAKTFLIPMYLATAGSLHSSAQIRQNCYTANQQYVRLLISELIARLQTPRQKNDK